MLLCATTVVLAWAAPWRASLRPSRPATIALAALAALGVWAALSALWSPAPDVAIETAQRILTYALAFGLGIWLSTLLGSRLHLALVPLAAAGAFAGIVAVVGMLTGDHVRHYLELDGTLEFPLGYRNANAAFFAIALWPALGLASRRAGAWPVRAAALATATLCLDLAMLSQSRGSLLAGAVGALRLPAVRDGPRAQAGMAGARGPSGPADPALPGRPLPRRQHGRPAERGARRAARGGTGGCLDLAVVAGDRCGGGAGGQTRSGLAAAGRDRRPGHGGGARGCGSRRLDRLRRRGRQSDPLDRQARLSALERTRRRPAEASRAASPP